MAISSFYQASAQRLVVTIEIQEEIRIRGQGEWLLAHAEKF
ncbi:MAG: hypothetical protein ACO2YY_10265 [Pseudohongiellaceae bacterium]